MKLQNRLGKYLLSWPPLVYLVLFFLIPTCIMFVAAFRFPGDYGGLAPMYYIEEGRVVWDLTLENFQRIVEEPIYLELFLKSAGYAGLTTLVCILMAYPLAWLIARSQKKHRDLMLLLVILPFWSNFLIRIYAWMIILGPQSAFTKAVNWVWTGMGFEPLQLLFTPFAVIVGMVYVHLPFMVLPLYANLEKHDMSLLAAAQDLGANAWQRFWKITWPLSLPGIFAGSALVFIPALGMFAIPDILGGTDSIMIGNLIKQQILDTRDWPFGAVLSIMLTAGVLGIAALGSLVARGGVKRG
ncbi:ABC transporter permease [Craterilacuibacter sinensis]|uniref:ABC transporter permease subunit n=1 Tax=Craterilacuibacter sinensis TaxID=2686017 RepID=A0A845BZZ8_9NEIS|nr:ABC transporter permease [Craterilacuibacter sinensis]MXR38063.1 ABC transporter permease subunit [Craterilacuibacter sinensis]RQW26436.1 ABC transporter permease [Rhodobacteraceae bacterium CH30]